MQQPQPDAAPTGMNTSTAYWQVIASLWQLGGQSGPSGSSMRLHA